MSQLGSHSCTSAVERVANVAIKAVIRYFCTGRDGFAGLGGNLKHESIRSLISVIDHAFPLAVPGSFNGVFLE